MSDLTSENQGVSVFLSYSHEDDEFRSRLIKHLSNLEYQGVISAWHDRQIPAGKERQGEIDHHLESAQLILLLVSADFLHSPCCYSIEMRRALERHHNQEAYVIPILLRPVDWQGSPLSKLQILPTDAKPISQWNDIDEAFLNVVEGIRDVISQINKINRNRFQEDIAKNQTIRKNVASLTDLKSISNSKILDRKRIFNISIDLSIINRIFIFISASALIAFIFIIYRPSKGTINVRVPQKERKDKYYYDILELALRETESEGAFTIDIIEVEGPQINELTQTNDNKVDVVWMMTNFEREYHARPVKIPLTQGLLGYRICMISRGNEKLFDNIKSLTDFKGGNHSIGQVHDWPDTRILRESGINVKSYETKSFLFHKLEQGDIDCFARGTNEIWDELATHKNLTFDNNFFFKYRSPIYFFVEKNNHVLAERIERGLKSALENGEFCRLLMLHYREAISKAKLTDRNMIKLENYDLPRGTPSEYYLSFELPQYPESRGDCMK